MEKKKNDPYAALRFREFNIFLLVRFAMVFAWSMQFVVIEWQVYSITKDPFSLGIIGLMEVIPAVSLALFAGHVVDQKEKKGLLLKCILGFSVISFGLFLITWPEVIGDWSQNTVLYTIYALVFLGGVVRSFIGPTIFSLFSLLVPKKIYPNAATWSSSVWQMGAVVGPAIAGFAINWIGVHWSMCFVFACSLVAFLSLTQIPKKPILNTKIGEPVFKSLKEGLNFVFSTKIILGALTLDMFAVLFGGAVALLPVFAQDILKVGPEGFGVLRAAPAVGALIIMFTSAYFPLNKNAGYKLLGAIFAFGCCIILFGVSTWFWVSVIALFLSGITDGISMIIRQTILQLRTPDEMRGRVASVNSMFVGSSNELGAFESGLTAKLMGTVTAVIFGGSMTLITVVSTGALLPSLRKLDLRKDLEEHELKE
ncbi:MFS transporter [Croceibacter atlanticus]|jgi:MFS family permease|uniref:Putative transporter n=1 Tax=Croceibacter atlanticus (strain ATCC BAA-628 / JCM 21780 / CIP 108009 / IAM 15332 / KCTC 12090 / HTCC2559) TaxID=216432 RepID=A3U982_CROAH|nr:MFS transporter [Croceibacter atlanticus]EAP86368.1 putative transporter [Croceibacter atlanticus HTCC2559]